MDCKMLKELSLLRNLCIRGKLKFLKNLHSCQKFKLLLLLKRYVKRFRYIDNLKKVEPCCPLCNRNFEHRDDAQSLIDELTGKIREVPNRLERNNATLEEKQELYNKLLKLEPVYKSISTLKNKEIPNLVSDLEKTETKLKTLRNELDELSNEILGPQTDEAICSSIQVINVYTDNLKVFSFQSDLTFEINIF